MSVYALVRNQSTDRRAAASSPTPVVVPGPSRLLDEPTRSVMETAFRHDFSGVRLHTDEHAARSAQSLGATAYTRGRHIVFGSGRYAPHTGPGQRLLAHELAHVVQQSGTSETTTTTNVGSADSPLERQADQAAAAVTTGRPFTLSRTTSTPVIQREGPTPGTITTPAPGSPAWQAAVAKAENDKLGKDKRDEMMNAALKYAAEREPLKSLIAQGKAFAGTPGGLIAITEAATALITAFVLAHEELPITSYTFDLGMISKDLTGLTITPTWKGPANNPTEAGVKVVVAPNAFPFSFSAGAKTGSKTPTAVDLGIGYKPGFLPGTSLAAGVSIADKASPLSPLDPRQAGARVVGSAALNWKVPGGLLRGSDLGAKGTLDDVGNKSLMFTLTIPLGGSAKKD